MGKIGWTEEAECWIRDIYDYIAERRPRAAHRTIDGIYRKVQLLRKFPRIGYRYEQIHDREVRVILYGHYRIAYLVKSDESIDILGVFHASMEIERYLG